ncbi:MAG: RidA family protein [Hyphomonadaceae bacterium]|nr:RidA family protein [Hyphomonadaceae bacterium]
MHKALLPEGWVRPKGYANGIAATGRFVFTAGVIGWNSKEEFEHTDFASQFRQVLINTVAILAEAEAQPEHIVRMTCYVTSKQAYLESLPDVGAAWREILGRTFPCMAVVEVSALIEDAALLEIETTAVVPNS